MISKIKAEVLLTPNIIAVQLDLKEGWAVVGVDVTAQEVLIKRAKIK